MLPSTLTGQAIAYKQRTKPHSLPVLVKLPSWVMTRLEEKNQTERAPRTPQSEH